MTTFSICLSSFLPKVEIRSQKSISVRFFWGNLETNLGQPCIHLLVAECTLAISIYHCIEARSPQGTNSLSASQCKYLNYHVDCFCLSFYSENLLRESLGLTVEKEMDTAFSNMKTKLCSSFQLIGSSKVSHFSNQRPLSRPSMYCVSFEFSQQKWPQNCIFDYRAIFRSSLLTNKHHA